MPRKSSPLTDTAIRNCRAGKREVLLSDGAASGLVLRVRSTSKDWFFRYSVEGRRSKIGLGEYPTISLSEARKLAGTQAALLSKGIDPRQERDRVESDELAKKAAAEALPQTVAELFELFVTKALVKRKDSGQFVRQMFDRDVRRKIGGLRLSELRRAHVMAVLDDINDRGASRVAGIVLADLRQMCRWAVAREILESDPTTGISKADIGGIARERDRVLSDGEIRLLAAAMPETLSLEACCAVSIMLATGCRIGELVTASWSDVDFDTRTWRIPAATAKNGKAHFITLSDFALSQFSALRARVAVRSANSSIDATPWVMPARHHAGHVCPKSLAKQIGDRQRDSQQPMSHRSPHTNSLALPGGKWTPHDLRRTAATQMAALGIAPEVIERCLNHSEPNRMKRIYQRHDYAPEMALAWSRLGERLSVLFTPQSNVIALPRSA